MSVKIDAIRFKNEFRSESVDWLLANVGDKITIELDLSVSTYAISSSDNEIIGNNTDGYIGSGWITDPLGQFADFKVGDTISDYNYITSTSVGTYTIVDKLSDGEIQVTPAIGGGNNQAFSQRVFSIVKPITAVKYKYNFIENDEATSFDSKVNGTEQLLTASGLDASDIVTVNNMSFIGVKPYQIGSATIVGDGITTTNIYESKFKIVHTAYITPFILASQLTNIQNNTAPDYFLNLNCFKAIFDVEAAYDFNDPNYLVTVEVTETIGNSGWFNENFNTGLTNYTVDSIVYKNAGGTEISALELTDVADTTVEIVIKNTVDTPFSNNNTKFTLNFCKVPFDESEYQNNTRTLQQNFLFDRRLQTVGSASVNGDNFGTDYQVLKNITATFVSSSEIKIIAKTSFQSTGIDIINESEEHRYMLWVAIQNHTIQTKEADKVALFVDQNLFYENATDDGMIVNEITMLRHYEDDCDTQGTSPEAGVAAVPEVRARLTTDGIHNGIGGSVTYTINAGTYGVHVYTSSAATYDVAYNEIAVLINAQSSINGVNCLNSAATSFNAIPNNGDTPNNVWFITVSGSYFNNGTPKTFYFKNGVDAIPGIPGVTIDTFPEDEVVFCSHFYVDKNGREFDEIILKKITSYIKVINSSTLEEFVLETFTTDLSNLPFISGNQYVNFSLDKVYHIPTAEPRKAIKLERRIDLDAGGQYWYELSDPYLIRWEYWKSLATANSDFFDVGEPNNGWNQFWHRYNTIGDWDLTYEVNISATKNGDNLSFKSQAKIGTNNYNTNADWNPNTIKTYKNSDNTYLFDGLKNYILGYDSVRVEAEFTKVSGTPILANIYVVIGIEVFEEGGIDGRRRLSSIWLKDGDTWLDSTTGNSLVNLSLSGNTVKAVCLIDQNKIPLDKKKFKLTARLYEISTDVDSKNFQNGDNFLFQNADNYLLQSQ